MILNNYIMIFKYINKFLINIIKNKKLINEFAASINEH